MCREGTQGIYMQKELKSQTCRYQYYLEYDGVKLKAAHLTLITRRFTRGAAQIS
jgi:hypothetical protein